MRNPTLGASPSFDSGGDGSRALAAGDVRAVSDPRLGPCPTINIVTVVFNAVHALAATIESVRKNRRKNVKYWIFDGQSRDGTIDLIRSSDTVDFWFSEPDQGIYDAMNKAVTHIPEGLILFLGAGDELLALPPDEDLSGADIFYGDVMVGDRRFASVVSWEFRFGNTLHHQGLLIDKRVLPTPAFDLSFPVYSDLDLNQRLYKAGVRFKRLNCVISRATEGGVSWSASKLGMAAVAQKNFGFIAGGISFALIVARALKMRLSRPPLRMHIGSPAGKHRP